MAFESINVSSLRNALTSCKNTINHNYTDEIIGNITNSNIWKCNSRDTLSKALSTLSTKRYKALEDRIDKYLEATSKIEKYKRLKIENENLKAQYNDLSNNLYYTNEYTETTTDEEGNEVTETHTETLIDYSVENEMNEIDKKIEENKLEMDRLERQVANSI